MKQNLGMVPLTFVLVLYRSLVGRKGSLSLEPTEPDTMTVFADDPRSTRLAMEVKEAIDCDPLCGPASDRAKHFIGE